MRRRGGRWIESWRGSCTARDSMGRSAADFVSDRVGDEVGADKVELAEADLADRGVFFIRLGACTRGLRHRRNGPRERNDQCDASNEAEGGGHKRSPKPEVGMPVGTPLSANSVHGHYPHFSARPMEKLLRATGFMGRMRSRAKGEDEVGG